MAVFNASRVGTFVAVGASASLALIAYGFAEHPKASLLSVAAAAIVLTGYGAIGLRVRGARSSANLQASSIAGLVAGAVFGAEILLEYVYQPSSNVAWGYAEFGTVFLICALAAAWAAWRERAIRGAVGVAALTAVISSLIWCLVLLSSFFALEGTNAQTAVLVAEGDPDDFLRSGMSDYATFLIEDLFGATFFHLLLGPLIAALLGLIASAPVVAFRRRSGRAN